MAIPAVSLLGGRVMDSFSFVVNFVQWVTKAHVIKGKWQQKFNAIDSKTMYRSLYKIFIPVLFLEIFSPKSTNCPPFWINF